MKTVKKKPICSHWIYRLDERFFINIGFQKAMQKIDE